MPLENFGSILNFAEQIESEDRAFYEILANNPACAEQKSVYEGFATDAQKNIKNIQRTRRENVTEMILEPVKDFVRAPFYYTEAAEKIKAQPEVARALKTVGKKRKAHIDKLADL